MEPTQKVYIVESHYGEYEDKSQRIDGIFTDRIEAEKLKESIAKEYTEALLTEVPEIDWDTATPFEINENERLYMTRYDAQGFNSAIVTEYELNVKLP